MLNGDHVQIKKLLELAAKLSPMDAARARVLLGSAHGTFTGNVDTDISSTAISAGSESHQKTAGKKQET